MKAKKHLKFRQQYTSWGRRAGACSLGLALFLGAPARSITASYLSGVGATRDSIGRGPTRMVIDTRESSSIPFSKLEILGIAVVVCCYVGVAIFLVKTHPRRTCAECAAKDAEIARLRAALKRIAFDSELKSRDIRMSEVARTALGAANG